MIRSAILPFFFGLIGLIAAGTASAKENEKPPVPVIQTAESELIFSGQPKEVIERTLRVTLTGGKADSLQAHVKSDFVTADSKQVVAATKLTVTPSDLDGSEPRAWLIALRFNGTELVGRFKGALELVARAGTKDDAVYSSAVSVGLTILVEELPALVVAERSKSLTIDCIRDWRDIPLGRPAQAPPQVPSSPSEVLASTTVDLKSQIRSPVKIAGAKALGMRDTTGLALPAGVLQVQEPLKKPAGENPYVVEPGTSVSLPVHVFGSHLPAGTFLGTIRITLSGRPDAPIEVPVTLRIKHGPLFPLLTLVLGLITSLLLAWWKGGAKEKRDLSKSIEALIQEMKEAKNLPKKERQAVNVKIREILASFKGDDLDGLTEKISATKNDMEQAQTIVRKQMERINGLRTRLDSLPDVPTKKQPIGKDLDDVYHRAERGEFESAEELKAVVEAIEKKLNSLESLLELIKKESDSLTNAALQMIDSAESGADLIKGLGSVGDKIAAGLQFDFSLGGPGKTIPNVPEALQSEFRKESSKLRYGAIAISFVLYGFALVVGFTSLYSASPTFGSAPQDYIPLFLWAATTEALRGKMFGLADLKTTFSEHIR